MKFIFKGFVRISIPPLNSTVYAEEESITIFRRKDFVSQYPCVTVAEPFGVSENFWYWIFLCIRGGRGGRGEGWISRYSVGSFLSHSTEKFVGEPFLVSEKFWYRNFSYIRGGAVSRFFVVINKWKNVGKGRNSSPYLRLQNIFILSIVPWEPLEFLINFTKIIQIFGATETWTRTYCLRTLLS